VNYIYADESGEVRDRNAEHDNVMYVIRLYSRAQKRVKFPISGNANVRVIVQTDGSYPIVLHDSSNVLTNTVISLNLPSEAWVTLRIYAYFGQDSEIKFGKGIGTAINNWETADVVPPTVPSWAPTPTATGWLDEKAGTTQVTLNWYKNREEDIGGYNIYRYEYETTDMTVHTEIHDSVSSNTFSIESTVATGTVAPAPTPTQLGWTDDNAEDWSTNRWTGYLARLATGTLDGKQRPVKSSDGSSLSLSDYFPAVPASGDEYEIIGDLTFKVPTGNKIKLGSDATELTVESTMFVDRNLALNSDFLDRTVNDFDNWTEQNALADQTDYLYNNVAYKGNVSSTYSFVVSADYIDVDEDVSHTLSWATILLSGSDYARADIECYSTANALLGTLQYTDMSADDTDWTRHSFTVYPSGAGTTYEWPDDTDKVKLKLWASASLSGSTSRCFDGVLFEWGESASPYHRHTSPATWVRVDQAIPVGVNPGDAVKILRYSGQFRRQADATDKEIVEWIDTTVAPSTEYAYSIASYDIYGNVSTKSSSQSVTSGDTGSPAVVSGVSGSTRGRSVGITWKNPADTDIHGVNIYDNDTGDLILAKRVFTPSATERAVLGEVTDGASAMHYRVESFDKLGNTGTSVLITVSTTGPMSTGSVYACPTIKGKLYFDDATAYIEQDGSTNLAFTDSVAGTHLLDNLADLTENETVSGTWMFSTNLGLGTLTPQAQLHIEGSVPGAVFFDSDSAIGGSNPAWLLRAQNDGTVRLQTTSDYNTYTTRFFFYRNGGLGLGGVTSLTARLTVLYNSNTPIVDLRGTNAYNHDLKWTDTSSDEQWIWSHRSHANGNRFEAWHYTGGGWLGSPAISFATDNKVGINRTGANAFLHVAGDGIFETPDDSANLTVWQNCATPSGNLLNLQAGTGGADAFKVDISGNVTAIGTVDGLNLAEHNHAGGGGEGVQVSHSALLDTGADDHHNKLHTIASASDHDWYGAGAPASNGQIPIWSNDNSYWYAGDHGDMSGKGDDDHTQYLLASGGRGLAGDWDAGAHKITAEQFAADIADGTTPFEVTSTTKVSNLNVDRVDNFHANGSPTSGNLYPLDGSAKFPFTVLYASHAAVANYLLRLDASAEIPNSALKTGSGNGLDADQVDGKDSSDLLLVDGSQPLTANWDAGAYQIDADEFYADTRIHLHPQNSAPASLSDGDMWVEVVGSSHVLKIRLWSTTVTVASS